MEQLKKPHKRYNPLLDKYVLVSAHRIERPWEGGEEGQEGENEAEYDEKCYLCPKNKRAHGDINPDYKSTFVFTNDFSALLQDNNEKKYEDRLLKAFPEKGICRVICYSPKHNLRIPLMKETEIESIIDTWRKEYLELGSLPYINHVQIFENRGKIMGCSNMHPHGQIWAEEFIPDIPLTEGISQKKFIEANQECLLCQYLNIEYKQGERIVYMNDSFAVMVPFWAEWPFETMIIPKRHIQDISQITEKEKKDLASVMKILGIKYDNLFKTSFPYSMGIHQAPTDNLKHEEWHMHFHYYPPLLRSSKIKKFMVGYELLAMAQRDITPEAAAKKLIELPEVHY